MSSNSEATRGSAPQNVSEVAAIDNDNGQPSDPIAPSDETPPEPQRRAQEEASSPPPGSIVTVDIQDLTPEQMHRILSSVVLTPAQMRRILSSVHRADPAGLSNAAAPVLGLESNDNKGRFILVDRGEDTGEIRRPKEKSAKEKKKMSSTKDKMPTAPARKRKAVSSEGDVPKRRKWDERWDGRLEELKRYKMEHGDCNVSSRGPNPSLGKWVDKQRQEYKCFQEFKPSQITAARIAALEDLGFVWRLGAGRKWAVSMEKRIEQLRAYKELYGHTNVNKRTGPDPQLGRWVDTQRKEYRKMQLGKPSVMTAERVDALNEIGFIWRIEKHIPKATWEERLDQLKEFKAQHGHTNVSISYKPNLPLATWVAKQRADHRKILQGQASAITAKKIAALNAIGFKWRLNKKRGSKEANAVTVALGP